MVTGPAPAKHAFLTLDLEPDHCDLIDGFHYDSFRGIDALLDLLAGERIALTVFVTGKVLDERRDAALRFAAEGAEMELHAYSHKRPSVGITEISQGIEAYGRAFGRSPQGYRAPLGMISAEEITFLASSGFRFDSSLFPSLFPGRFSNVSAPSSPFVHPGTELIELPISVVPRVRFPVSLSYIQLASHLAFRTISSVFPLPDRIVIDCHLHDIFPSHTFRALPLKWKLIYSRFFVRNRKKGLRDFGRLVTLLKSRGYEFGTMADYCAMCESEGLR